MKFIFDFFFQSNCTSMVSIRAEDINNAFKEELDKALAERDEMWRKHEKEQIVYLQQQNSHLLSRLHTEIERLSNVNRGKLLILLKLDCK